MARQCSYSKRDLVVTCSKTKKSIEKNLEIGKIDKKKITKSYVYNELAKRLKLSDSASFYRKTYIYYEYLDSWYKGLCEYIEELEEINPLESSDSTLNSKNSSSSNYNNPTPSEYKSEEIDNLRLEIKEKDKLIKYLNNVIKELRMENESLRLNRINRIHKLDSNRKSDILDESLDSVEIKHLYDVIKKLYDSTF